MYPIFEIFASSEMQMGDFESEPPIHESEIVTPLLTGNKQNDKLNTTKSPK